MALIVLQKENICNIIIIIIIIIMIIIIIITLLESQASSRTYGTTNRGDYSKNI